MILDRNKVAQARIMVVGCGALGNEVLKNLVLSGVSHLVCVDFDSIEPGNLTRSVLFRKEDASARRLKTEVVSERLKELNPELDVRTIDGDIAFDVGLATISRMDAVVSCVDSRWARFMIGRHCNRTGRPWVDGGIGFWEGTARVFVPGENCYACSLGPEGLAELRRRMPCANVVRHMERAGSAPTSVLTASVVGAVMAQEALKLVCGQQTICGRMFCYEGDVMDVRTASFKAWDEDCPEHVFWGPVENSHISSSSTVKELLDFAGRGCSLMLRDDCFVDWVLDRKEEKRTDVMLPGRCVEDFVLSGNACGGTLPGDFYQNEYRCIDSDFPYADMTLSQLGIPENDILHLVKDGIDRYIAMEEVEC